MKQVKVTLTTEQATYLLNLLQLDLQNLRELKSISRGLDKKQEDKEVSFVQRIFGKINQAIG